jgi:hypothetical protein
MPQKGYEERLAYRTAYYLANKERIAAQRKAQRTAKAANKPPKEQPTEQPTEQLAEQLVEKPKKPAVQKKWKQRTAEQKITRAAWSKKYYSVNKERILAEQKKYYYDSKADYQKSKEDSILANINRSENVPLLPVINDTFPMIDSEQQPIV